MGYIDMDKYFQVLNNHNILQIDDNYKNLSLLNTKRIDIEAHLQPNYAGHTEWRFYGEWKVDGVFPIGAVSAEETSVPFICLMVGDAVRVYTDREHKESRFIGYTYSFRETVNQHSGIAIYNRNGDVVFSSVLNYMKVVAHVSGDVITVVEGESGIHKIVWQHGKFMPLLRKQKGHKYALVQGQFPYFFYDMNPQGHSIGTMAFMETEDEVGLIPMKIGTSDWKDINIPYGNGYWDPITSPVNYIIIDAPSDSNVDVPSNPKPVFPNIIDKNEIVIMAGQPQVVTIPNINLVYDLQIRLERPIGIPAPAIIKRVHLGFRTTRTGSFEVKIYGKYSDNDSVVYIDIDDKTYELARKEGYYFDADFNCIAKARIKFIQVV